MTKSEFYRLCDTLLISLRGVSPIDTGNLRYNAIKMVRIDANTVEIYVDCNIPGGIAPYMVYTNEPWISPKWHGKKNPNEGWWNTFVEVRAIFDIITRTKGKVK